MPAATVALLSRSMRMKAPVARFSRKASKAIAVCVERLATPTSFILSDFAGPSLRSSMFTRRASSVTVTLT
jgi:hypothetical protein